MEEVRLYALDEDIKICEEIKEMTLKACECGLSSGSEKCKWRKEAEAIEHLIEAYRKVKEEELHWKGQYHLLSRKIDVIPKSKVKEKIEEILEKGKQMSEKERQEETQFMQGKLKALEELLEEV